MSNICKNCDQPTTDQYCAHCGQKNSTVRFTLKHLLHEFLHGFYHVDHGLFYTAKELALRPGKTIKFYLRGKRKKYFNPFTFILVLGGINALILKKLHWQNLFIDLGLLDSRAINQVIWNSSLEHFTVRLLLGIPIYSVISYLFYFKERFTFAEHTIANTYVRGELNLFMILLEVLVLVSPLPIYQRVLKFSFVILYVIYLGWTYSGAFGQMKKFGLAKGIATALVAISAELVILNMIISNKVADHLLH